MSVLGLGYIGLPTAIMLARCGYEVLGYDANPNVVASLQRGKIHIKENDLQLYFEKVFNEGTLKIVDNVVESDVFIVAVPTPFKESIGKKEADLSYIDAAAKLVSKVLKEENLVVLESTSPPMTTRRMTDMLVAETGLDRNSFYTAHCPERVLPGRILYELEHNDRIIGAEREEAAMKAKEVYQPMVKEGHIYITDDVTAEMAKLVENSYRDVNIAFANELSLVCDELNIDVNELIQLANKHPRVNILQPGIGVGGHCISVDPWFLVEKFEKANIIKMARTVNDSKPYWVAHKIEEAINYDKSKVIGILGLAFKPNIDDLRESPSEVIIKELLNKGYRVIGCEPNVNEDTAFGIKLMSIEECYESADILLLAQQHDEFIEAKEMIDDKLIVL